MTDQLVQQIRFTDSGIQINLDIAGAVEPALLRQRLVAALTGRAVFFDADGAWLDEAEFVEPRLMYDDAAEKIVREELKQIETLMVSIAGEPELSRVMAIMRRWNERQLSQRYCLELVSRYLQGLPGHDIGAEAKAVMENVARVYKMAGMPWYQGARDDAVDADMYKRLAEMRMDEETK